VFLSSRQHLADARVNFLNIFLSIAHLWTDSVTLSTDSMGYLMVRDLVLGSMLGMVLLIWRGWVARKSVSTVPKNLSQGQSVDQLQKELAIAQQKLAQSQQALTAETEKRVAVERELAEVNQLSGDRVVQLAELIAENVELKAQLEQVNQPRRRKKRTPKAEGEEPQTTVALAEPLEEIPEATPFELDLSLIQQKQAETQTATDLLQPIFMETEVVIAPALNTGALDTAHSSFVQILSQQPSWTREALELEAQGQGLMLDGALEIINEAAFETCDKPLVEGDDPIEVNAAVLKELLA
jgi:small-conductance mechanosensitive channel